MGGKVIQAVDKICLYSYLYRTTKKMEYYFKVSLKNKLNIWIGRQKYTKKYFLTKFHLYSPPVFFLPILGCGTLEGEISFEVVQIFRCSFVC